MAGLDRDRLRASIRKLIRPVLYPMVLLASAGSLTWLPAWRLFSILVAFRILGWLVFRKSKSQSVRRSGSSPMDGGSGGRLSLLAILALDLTMLAVCGLDGGRYHFSRAPEWFAWLGPAVMLPALGLGLWTLLAAPRFRAFLTAGSEDRADIRLKGPYRLVRHPRITGLVFSTPARALILGSPWGLGVAGLIVILLIRQAWLLDDRLGKLIPGFVDFSRRTRYRVIPLIW